VNIDLIGENFKREFCTAAKKLPMRPAAGAGQARR
tara:strand:- start:1 stop:105 length:105 start_codon:yes stop_codon:yes gene_type:complete